MHQCIFDRSLFVGYCSIFILLVHHLQFAIYYLNYQRSITPTQPYTDIDQVIVLNNNNLAAADDLLLIHAVDVY